LYSPGPGEEVQGVSQKARYIVFLVRNLLLDIIKKMSQYIIMDTKIPYPDQISMKIIKLHSYFNKKQK